jgi:hypothetical protein
MTSSNTSNSVFQMRNFLALTRRNPPVISFCGFVNVNRALVTSVSIRTDFSVQVITFKMESRFETLEHEGRYCVGLWADAFPTSSSRFCDVLKQSGYEGIGKRPLARTRSNSLLCSNDTGSEAYPTSTPVYVEGLQGLDRLCGLVVRVLGYRSRGPGSIPGTTKKK